MRDPENIIEVRDLSIAFTTDDGPVHAVRGIDFDVAAGKTVALLGESGCGKSVTARAILNFIDPPAKRLSGEVHLQRGDADESQWVDVLSLRPNSKAMRRIRWGEIAMIFQDPRNSLTPAYTVGDQITEAIREHDKAIARGDARLQAIRLLEQVGIPGPERRVDDYPHQLSGGMCQRVMIAMALACKPRLLIADEPTTALDVTIQAQVLELMRVVQREQGMSILLITHDMGVVAEMADEVVVMYMGRVCERGPVHAVFDDPQHPYTRRLFESTPKPGLVRGVPLPTIPGSVPDHAHLPEGCPFRGRCDQEFESCSEVPPAFERGEHHSASCWLHDARTGAVTNHG